MDGVKYLERKMQVETLDATAQELIEAARIRYNCAECPYIDREVPDDA